MEGIAAEIEGEKVMASMMEDAQLNVRRVIKYDIDSYIADDKLIMDEEEEEGEEEHEGEDDPEEDKKILTSLYSQDLGSEMTWEEKWDSMMEKVRADYQHLSLLQCILYANLIVFSIAATVAYMFYIPPGQNKRNSAKNSEGRILNMPSVNLETIKVPKKEIKKQLKKVVKNDPKKNAKELLI